MILVVGGAGFIGRNLVRALLDSGEIVNVLDNYATGRPLWEHPRLGTFAGDVADAAILERAAKDASAIVNASCINIVESQRKPLKVIRTNVTGAVGVLQQAKEIGAKVVHLSSCSVYGDQSKHPIREEATTFCAHPYAASKLAGEAYAQAYSAQGWVNATILRLSNVYGPGQHPDFQPGVIGRFVRNAVVGETSVIHGDGSECRDFTYVDDVVLAIGRALDSDASGPFNISWGVGQSISGLAKMIGGKYRHEERRPIDGVRNRALDNTKAQRELGWKATTPITKGLALTREWAEKAYTVPV